MPELEEWKQRLIEEYTYVKTKYNALHRSIVAFDAGVCPIKPAEGIIVWKEQAKAMGTYLFILEKRMAINKMEVPKI